MNMISELRRRVNEKGSAEISVDEFNQLQSEWITRCGGDDILSQFRNDTLSELDSKISVSSQEVTDEFGSKKMAVLIEDIEPILQKI